MGVAASAVPQSVCMAAGLRKVKESFLPFWAMSAEVTVLLKSAQVGWDSWQPVYNPATRQALSYPRLFSGFPSKMST